jgi:hypothetical protein
VNHKKSDGTVRMKTRLVSRSTRRIEISFACRASDLISYILSMLFLGPLTDRRRMSDETIIRMLDGIITGIQSVGGIVPFKQLKLRIDGPIGGWVQSSIMDRPAS